MRQSVVLNEVLAALSGEPVIALVVAAALTALSTSSLAVILLVISLVTHGIVDLPLGFALVLGANLGGGITPLLGTLGAEPEARRVPLGNLVFRALGVVALVRSEEHT